MKSIILFLASSALLTASARAQVVINEVMQSNIDCIMDDLNEFPDSWVELYNPGPSAVNLSHYSVNDANDPSKAFQLPSFNLGAKCYALVYCDKEGSGFHAPFRLESGKGCTFYLYCDGQLIDQLPEGMKKQPAPNISFGRKTDGDDTWGYQLTATPKAANCGKIADAKKLLGEPIFSVPGQVMTSGQTFALELSLPEDAPEGTVIRYTANTCEEPTETSPIYTEPIQIAATRVVRAKLFCDGWLSPRSTTHSYIQHPRQLTLPVVSVSTKQAYLTDPKIGIYSSSKSFDGKENYNHNWRRPAQFELFEQAGEPSVLNQLCETRITGGATRGNALKSMGFYANKRFGEKRFKYEFFPDERPSVTDFKSIMMRNAGNDFDYLYMRDAIIQRLMSQYVDIDHQAWRPAIFYLNGQYKGILNIRERSNEDNIYTNYDGLEEIDMVENWWELKEGRWSEFQAFMDFYNAHGHTYEEYDKIMDVQEFMNVMILNLFFCNLDFPGNNIVWWKPQAEGGRWRILVKDTDFGLGLYGRDPNYKVLEWLHNPNYDASNAWANQYEHTRLFRRLEEDERFLREFIDRCAIYMGDFMNYERTWEVWQPMYNMIRTEYTEHRKLYNPWWPNYAQELGSAQNWLMQRVKHFYNQLADYYKLGNISPLVINKELSASELEQIQVSFNGVQLSRAAFNGKFYQGRTVTLQGEHVAGWQIVEITRNGELRKTEVEGNSYTFTMPYCTSITINAKVEQGQGIDSLNTDSTQHGDILEIYDESGMRRLYLQRGSNIVRYADGTVKKIWY
ncbi:MAG: CotH kinase family protein [Bacteroidales bacterium]|nr:CotH kinase family protein [Bacteroidales bacterium]